MCTAVVLLQGSGSSWNTSLEEGYRPAGMDHLLNWVIIVGLGSGCTLRNFETHLSCSSVGGCSQGQAAATPCSPDQEQPSWTDNAGVQEPADSSIVLPPAVLPLRWLPSLVQRVEMGFGVQGRGGSPLAQNATATAPFAWFAAGCFPAPIINCSTT